MRGACHKYRHRVSKKGTARHLWFKKGKVRSQQGTTCSHDCVYMSLPLVVYFPPKSIPFTHLMHHHKHTHIQNK